MKRLPGTNPGSVGLPAPSVSPVRVGVAGWSYADWVGVVYPASSARGPAALRATAELFDVIEINSSFYHLPATTTTARWRDTVEDLEDFEFTAKLPSRLSHEERPSPGEIRRLATEFQEAFRPLIEAGRLETVLLQLPPWTREGPAARDLIERVVEAHRPLHTVVEVRDASFLRVPGPGQPPSLLPFLEQLGAGFANVDLPEVPGAPPPTSVNTSATAYVRLHGRNARAWTTRGVGRDQKYDYHYPRAELESWVSRIEDLSRRTHAVVVIANNHFRGQAPSNALDLLELLNRAPRGTLPPALGLRFRPPGEARS